MLVSGYYQIAPCFAVYSPAVCKSLPTSLSTRTLFCLPIFVNMMLQNYKMIMLFYTGFFWFSTMWASLHIPDSRSCLPSHESPVHSLCPSSIEFSCFFFSLIFQEFLLTFQIISLFSDGFRCGNCTLNFLLDLSVVNFIERNPDF